MTAMRSGPGPYDSEPDAAVAARCVTLAEQIGGGPVRDALLAMARDYTERARDTARATAARITHEYDHRATPRRTLANWMSELFEPLPARPAPARRAAPTTRASAVAPLPVPVKAAPVAHHGSQPTTRRTSRLYRMHALTRLD